MQPTINNKTQKKRQLLVFLLTDLNIWWYDEVGIVRLKRNLQSTTKLKTNATNHPTNSIQTNKLPACLLTHWSQLFIGKATELCHQKGINEPIINNNTLNKQETDLSEEKQATIKNATNQQPIKWKEPKLPEGPGWLGLIVGQQARRGQSSPKSPCRARSAWPGYY